MARFSVAEKYNNTALSQKKIRGMDSMQRYYQGQLDFFCAIYAVINALTALYGLSLSQARALFASMLSDISGHPGLWKATLSNGTDFHWLTEHMLLACARGQSYPIRVFRPFTETHELSESAADLAAARSYCEAPLDEISHRPENAPALWKAFTDFLPQSEMPPKSGTARRVAVLRFHRYMRFFENPVVSHWTVADRHQNDVLHLRDASKEENALYSLARNATVFSPELVSPEQNVRVEPESVYFIERQ